MVLDFVKEVSMIPRALYGNEWCSFGSVVCLLCFVYMSEGRKEGLSFLPL